MFRRRRRGKAGDEDESSLEAGTPESGAQASGEGDSAASGGTDASGSTNVSPSGVAAVEVPPAGLSPRPDGPWDVTEVVDSDVERFDLGGVQLAIPDGAQVQLDVTPEGMVLPTVFVGEAAVQISAFAAPRRSGIWAEVRTEIAESLGEAGGQVSEVQGTFGTELHGQVPVQLPDGSVGFQLARFVGVDGPRWFLRGLFTGEAVEPGASAELEDAFRGTVVVRGSDAMAPRDPLPVTVPREILQAAGVPEGELPEAEPESSPEGGSGPEEQPALEPFQRGPEISEVR